MKQWKYFKRYPTVRAGMGFAYPIAITGTRVCKAEYDNETWVSTMNSAVVSAYSNYNDWQWYTEDAARLDAKCGNKNVNDLQILADIVIEVV